MATKQYIDMRGIPIRHGVAEVPHRLGAAPSSGMVAGVIVRAPWPRRVSAVITRMDESHVRLRFTRSLTSRRWIRRGRVSSGRLRVEAEVRS